MGNCAGIDWAIAQIRRLDAEIADALPDAEIYRSFFRSRDLSHLRRDAARRDR
jgi:hypothetical protein